MRACCTPRADVFLPPSGSHPERLTSNNELFWVCGEHSGDLLTCQARALPCLVEKVWPFQQSLCIWESAHPTTAVWAQGSGLPRPPPTDAAGVWALLRPSTWRML